jgi:hypothetical protein
MLTDNARLVASSECKKTYFSTSSSDSNNDGSEDCLILMRSESDDALSKSLSSSSSSTEPATFSFPVAVAFCVNYNMGTGFLCLPWAFYEAGIMLSSIILLLIGLMSVLAVSFILGTVIFHLTFFLHIAI